MYVLHLIASTSLIIIYFSGTTKACNGYSLKLNYVRNCITGSIISVGDTSATLDKDCNLSVTTCAAVLKTFKTHNVKYTIKKPPMPMIEGEADACVALKNIKDPTAKEAFTMFAIPIECPLKAAKICSTPDKKLNVSRFKNQLGMLAGTTDIKLEGTHDVGKTCVEINFTISKAKRTG